MAAGWKWAAACFVLEFFLRRNPLKAQVIAVTEPGVETDVYCAGLVLYEPDNAEYRPLRRLRS